MEPDEAHPEPRRPRRSGARWAALLLAVAATVALDRLTKEWARTELLGAGTAEYLGGAVRIFYAENRGAFLGLGADWPDAVRFWVFTAATGVMLLVVAVVLVRGHRRPSRDLAFAFVLAGGASNLVDRIAEGYVVDFVQMGLGPLWTGVFNVADVGITFGVIWIATGRGCLHEPAPAPEVSRSPGR